ncbi:MAG: hypothetical protein ACOYMB_00115 [Patescibacteria group bacterium]
MKKEEMPTDIIKKYESEGWLKECHVGDHDIFVKEAKRVGINIKTGNIISLIDDSVERYQTTSRQNFSRRGDGPNLGVKYRDDEKM